MQKQGVDAAVELNDDPAIKANSRECELKKYGSLYFYKKKI
jgi:hypothetical protein